MQTDAVWCATLSRSEIQREPASLARRLASIVYDALLISGLLMAAGALIFVIRGGQAPPTDASWYSLYLFIVPLVFFTLCWCRGGQTLGMRSWRLRLVAIDGGRVTLARALARFFAALLSWVPAGAGFVWQLLDRESLCWHDRLSGTCLIFEPKKRG